MHRQTTRGFILIPIFRRPTFAINVINPLPRKKVQRENVLNLGEQLLALNENKDIEKTITYIF
jgi:hypothetical protein